MKKGIGLLVKVKSRIAIAVLGCTAFLSAAQAETKIEVTFQTGVRILSDSTWKTDDFDVSNQNAFGVSVNVTPENRPL